MAKRKIIEIGLSDKADKTNGVSQVTDTNANQYTSIGSLSSGASQQTINAAINTKLTLKTANFEKVFSSGVDYNCYLMGKQGKMVICTINLTIKSSFLGAGSKKFGRIYDFDFMPNANYLDTESFCLINNSNSNEFYPGIISITQDDTDTQAKAIYIQKCNQASFLDGDEIITQLIWFTN